MSSAGLKMKTRLGSIANMDKEHVLSVVKARLAALGLSAKDAAEIAPGAGSLIANLGRGRYKSPTIESVSTLADALGLEFYFGPPRRTASQDQATYLQEAERGFGTGRPVLPLPGARPGIDRLVLPDRWFRDHGIDPARAALLAADDAMAPAIRPGATVIIDGGDTDPARQGGRVYAVSMSGGAPVLRRVDVTPIGIVLRGDDPAFHVTTIRPSHLGTLTIHGRVRAVVSTLD
jgi:hypothetical protein